MASEFLDAFRHSAWANQQLLQYCRTLTEQQGSASASGGYGTIPATLKHIAGAEAYYRSLFSGSFPDWEWSDDAVQPIDEIAPWFADMAAFWEDLLARPVDVDQMLTRTRSNGQIMQMKAGVVLAQALHHANVHREQVSAVITSLGLVPPDLSAWAYGDATGGVIR